MKKLPKVEGLLSYRTDDKKLYLKEKAQWKALATQKDVSYTMYTNTNCLFSVLSICITSSNELIRSFDSALT